MPCLVTLDLRLEPSDFPGNDERCGIIPSHHIDAIAEQAFCIIPTLNLLCIRQMCPEGPDDMRRTENPEVESMFRQVFKRQPSQALAGVALESEAIKIHFHSARFEPESDTLFSPLF